jgi:hypothetical protein
MGSGFGWFDLPCHSAGTMQYYPKKMTKYLPLSG